MSALSSSQAARAANRGRPRWPRLLIRVSLILLLAGAAYTAYLDYRIRSQFEGKRWALPARVYARPLELFPGRRLRPAELAQELALLKYRPTRRGTLPGTYHRRGSRFVLTTRPFVYWDGREDAVTVRVDFDGEHLVSLAGDKSHTAMNLVRLDPAQIGGIYPAHNEDRILVRIGQIPEDLIKALILVEDRSFYRHHGIDPRAVARAVVANLRARHIVQGGSTLTQQLVKNYFLTNTRSYWRKFNEAIMSILLEWHYSKQEILEAYGNEVYLGQDNRRAIHGFGLASEFYFERPLDQLDLARQALLVALVRGPSFYDPRLHPERARQRRNLVLDLLHKQGMITEDAYRLAVEAPLGVSERSRSAVTAYPAFLDLVRRQLQRDYRPEDLNSEGLRIFTTLDPLVQLQSEQAMAGRITTLESQRGLPDGKLQGASVVVHPGNGEVLAMVGGRDPRYAGFNRALDAVRQVGSLIKPAVYLTALEKGGYTLATPLLDEPLTVKQDGTTWSPRNYDRKFHGQVALHQALAHSYNVPTARLGLAVGVPRVVNTLRRLGVSTPLSSFPSLLLGAVALSPYDIAQMYQTLAGGGFRAPLRAIRDVLDGDGVPLKHYPLRIKNVYDPAAVYLVDWVLKEVMRAGTGVSAYRLLPRTLELAGKTGTTNDLRDSWFAGFAADYLAVVWLGLDSNQSIGLTGASGALQVWADMMRELQPANLVLAQPDNIELVWIDDDSGLRANRRCRHRTQLPFIKGSAPEALAPCAGGQLRRSIGKSLNWLERLLK